MNEMDSFLKVVYQWKGSKKWRKQHQDEGLKGSQNKFQVLEEDEETSKEDQVTEGKAREKRIEDECDQNQKTEYQTETIMSESELEMDQDMNPSEMDLEYHELQEILDK